jgi:glycosyltransferase involved in cell wall biosynthesis
VTDPPRVLLFDPYPHMVYGGQRALLWTADELRAMGRPATIVLPGEGVLADRARASGHEVTTVALPGALNRFGGTTTGLHALAATAALPVAWARLRRAAAASRADIAHVSDHRGLLLMGPAARAAGLPVVWHAHRTDVPGRMIERTAGRLARIVIVASNAALADMTGLPRALERALVPEPIDPGVTALGPARSPGTGRVVMAARLHESKGVDVAIRAVAELERRGRPIHLDVYGAAPPGSERYAEELRALPSQLGVGGSVTFYDFVSSPHQSWLDADLYIQPSRGEMFGMAAAEAMALGLPVVASRVGGLAELISDGSTGVLVEPGQPAALAGAIQALLADPERGRRLGAAARARAAGLTPPHFVRSLIEVWRRVLNG